MRNAVPTPIPPRSVIRWAAAEEEWTHGKQNLGRIFRVGYYSRNDGLDCIWLVNESGDYEQTIDHDFLFKYFDVIAVSDETDVHGDHRPQIQPIVRAELPSQEAKPKRRTKAKTAKAPVRRRKH
jgi:hypothetical protein